MRKLLAVFVVALLAGCSHVGNSTRSSVAYHDSERKLQREVEALQDAVNVLKRKLEMCESIARATKSTTEVQEKALAARERAHPPKQRVRDLTAVKEILGREINSLEAQISAVDSLMQGPY